MIIKEEKLNFVFDYVFYFSSNINVSYIIKFGTLPTQNLNLWNVSSGSRDIRKRKKNRKILKLRFFEKLAVLKSSKSKSLWNRQFFKIDLFCFLHKKVQDFFKQFYHDFKSPKKILEKLYFFADVHVPGYDNLAQINMIIKTFQKHLLAIFIAVNNCISCIVIVRTLYIYSI